MPVKNTCTHNASKEYMHTHTHTCTSQEEHQKKSEAMLVWKRSVWRLVLKAGVEELWWSMKEGEFNICAAENLSSVKTPSKVVSLKSRFEGREGRAVTESEKKSRFVQQRSRPGKTTCCFFFEGGMWKSSIIQRRMQGPRRDTDMNTFSEGLRESATAGDD